VEGEMNRVVALLGVSVCSVLLSVPTNAAAQESFASVRNRVAPGDTVFVIDVTGTETRGQVMTVDLSTIRLKVNGTERQWEEAAVYRLERRGDSVKDGARRGVIAGAVVGAVLGAIAGATWANSGSGSTPIGGALGVGLVGAGLGLGIGVGMDALIQGRTLIYYR
jgi:hypothetical protein